MAKFFVNRPIVAMVISIIIVVAGLVVLQSLPVAMFPDITPPQVLVSTSYPGADALTIEQSVATPLEQQINGADYMSYVKSTSANDGSMTIDVTFDVGTDINMDQVLVQNRASQAMAMLPTDVKNWGVTVMKSSPLPVLLYSIYSPSKQYDKLFLSNYATINVVDRLLRVPGVGQVKVLGASDYSMRVWLQPDKLAKLGLTVIDVLGAIQKQNTVNPAGKFGDEPAPDGNQFTYTVRAQGRLVTAEEFGDIVVGAKSDGSFVRVSDVGRVELGALSYESLSRFNGAASAIVAVYQIPGSNALAVANGVKQAMGELARSFPPGMETKISLDTTLPITAGIHEITETLFEALLLVLLVVFIFLQSWRATIIPILTVPVSLIGTFIFFPLFGFSVNTLSLFGLVLAIGLVVDDAIVVVEGVEQWIERGLSPKEATIKAMSELTGPVIAIALILASVFTPVAFLGGIVGRMYQQFALTIAISVAISAFNALTLSPALCALLLKPRHEGRGPLARAFGGFNRFFDKTTKGYVHISEMLVHKTLRGIVFLAVLTGAAVLLGKTVPGAFLPLEDQGYFFMNVQLPDASSLQRTDLAMRKIEKLLDETPGIQSHVTVGGYSMLTGTSSPYAGFFFVQLKDWDERKEHALHADAIMAHLNAQLSRLPEGIAFAFPPPPIAGIGTTGGLDVMVQDRSGGTVAYLEQNLRLFLEEVRKRPEVAGMNSLFRASVPQIYADVDRDKALKLGVDVRDVYATLQTYLGGYYVNDFNRFGRQWKVFAQAEPDARINPDDIGRFFVRNSSRQMVPLSTLVTMRNITGPDYTNRYNLFRAAEVFGNPAPGYSSGQAMAAVEDVAQKTLPTNMGYEWTGISFEERKATGSVVTIFALSILFVFLILAAQYESWSLPFSVLLGTPIAVFGALLGLYSRRFSLDLFAQIGLIMLIGLAAKNSILRVAFAKEALDQGAPIIQAAMSGAGRRFRPILMTAFAFILGCVPLWIADGSGALSRRSLGTTVISGMTASTVVEIFIVPVLFVVVETIARKVKRRPPSAPSLETDAPKAGAQ